MRQMQVFVWSRGVLLAALLPALCSCGDGTVTFGSGDGDDNNDATVTVKGNLNQVTPVTSRDVVVFAYEITDDSDRCPCPSAPPPLTTQGKSVVVSPGETEFTLTGLDSGPIGVVFLLDDAGNNADGQIDPGVDLVAVLDDVDCELDDVDGNLTVTLKDVDIQFDVIPTTDCTDGSPSAGRARADTITKAKSTTTSTD